MLSPKNIREYSRLVWVEIRSFLLSDKAREVLVFLFFVLVSFGFWLLNTLDDIYRTDFRIPLRLKNVPKEVVLTSDFPDEVKVRVEDRGTVLLNYMLGRTFYPVSFDFNDFSKVGSHVRISSSELNNRISSQLNSTTKLISVQPDTMDIIFAHGQERRIPVVINGDLKAKSQSYVAEVLFDPDTVTAYAPKEILDTLKAALTEPLDMHDIKDTIHQRVALMAVRGAKISPAYIDMTICCDIYSEVTNNDIPIVGIGFPAGSVLRTFPSKASVTYRVGRRNYEKVKDSDFTVYATYDDVKNSVDGKVPLQLKTKLDFVYQLRVSPSEVEFLIEQQTIDYLDE